MDPIITPLLIAGGVALFRESSVTHRNYQTQETKRYTSQAAIQQRIQQATLKYQAEAESRQKAVIDQYIALCREVQEMEKVRLQALSAGFLACIQKGEYEKAEILRDEMREICLSSQKSLGTDSPFRAIGAIGPYKSLGSG